MQRDRRPRRTGRRGAGRLRRPAVPLHHAGRRRAMPSTLPPCSPRSLEIEGPVTRPAVRAALLADPARLDRALGAAGLRRTVHARAGDRPGRGDVHPGEPRRLGSGRPRPRLADALESRRGAGRLQGHRVAADRVLRPPDRLAPPGARAARPGCATTFWPTSTATT